MITHSHSNAPFLPRRFIGAATLVLQFFHQLLFDRLHRPTRFVDALVDRAGRERNAQPVSEKFLRPPARNVHAVESTPARTNAG
jgi:hypothetical protein